MLVNKTIFVGQWKRSEILFGEVTFKYTNDVIVKYTGEFNQGNPEGEGEMVWPDKRKYKG